MVDRFTVSLEGRFHSDVSSALSWKASCGADYLVLPLFSSSLHDEHSSRPLGVSNSRFGGADVRTTTGTLELPDWFGSVIGMVSSYLDLDSGVAEITKKSMETLRKELSWASHLSLPAVMLPQPNNVDCTNYARSVLSLCSPSQILYLKVPLLCRQRENVICTEGESLGFRDGWVMWNNFRQHFGNFNQLGVVLELDKDLFEESDLFHSRFSEEELDSTTNSKTAATTISSSVKAFLGRWAAEPVKAVQINIANFLMNKAGYPVLPRHMQRVLAFFFNYNVQVVLSGDPAANAVPSSTDGGDIDGTMLAYVQYIRHLWSQHAQRCQPNAHPFTDGYRDVLQAPLQPLMDNLESQTYETFERDPAKYLQYEQAIFEALSDIALSRRRSPTPALPAQSPLGADKERDIGSVFGVSIVAEQDGTTISGMKRLYHSDSVHAKEKDHGSSSAVDSIAANARSTKSGNRDGGSGDNGDKVVFLTVVGAGRGPLVSAALAAAVRAGLRDNVHIYAVEKNENAIITLHSRAALEKWGSAVEIIGIDMRDWQPRELCDVMISELLGSFGDNELSPECLDGAQKCLKPGGISIPSSYTSYIAPISSAKLWTSASAMGSMLGSGGGGGGGGGAATGACYSASAAAAVGASSIVGLETPFVVKLHRYFKLAEEQQLFTFSHPVFPASVTDTGTCVDTDGTATIGGGAGCGAADSKKVDNNRYAALTFTAPADCSTLLHGFAGYFHSPLYGSAAISIVPTMHTTGMFSWFPLFIPLQQPVLLEAGAQLVLHIWRCVDARRVWYEWSVSIDGRPASQIHNSRGRSYWIGL